MATRFRVTFLSLLLTVSQVAIAKTPKLEPDARLWLTLVTELVHQEEKSNLRPMDAWEESWQTGASGALQSTLFEFFATAHAAAVTHSCMIAGWEGIKAGGSCKSPVSLEFQAASATCHAPAFVCNPQIFGANVCADTSTSRWTKSCAEQVLTAAGVDQNILTNPKGPDSISLQDALKLSVHLAQSSVDPNNARALIQSICSASGNSKQDSYDCKAMNRIISAFYKKTKEGCADCVMESADAGPTEQPVTTLAKSMQTLQEKIAAKQATVLNEALQKMPCDEYVFSLTSSQVMTKDTTFQGFQQLNETIKKSAVTSADNSGSQYDLFSKAIGVCEMDKTRVRVTKLAPLSDDLLKKYHASSCGVLKPFNLSELNKGIDTKCPGYRDEVHRLFFKMSAGQKLKPLEETFLQRHADALADKNPGFFDPVDCLLAGISTCTEGGPRAVVRSSFTQLGDTVLKYLGGFVGGRIVLSKLASALPKLLTRWAAPQYTVLNPRMLGAGARVGSAQAVKSTLGSTFMRRLSFIFNPLHNNAQAMKSVQFLKDANIFLQAGAKNQALIALKSAAGAGGKFIAPALLRSYALTTVGTQAYDLLRISAAADESGESAKRLADVQANLDKIEK